MPFMAVCLATFLAAVSLVGRPWLWVVLIPSGVLAVLGIYDVVQQRHSVRRNYPVTGILRWLLEGIRPQIRQYLIESDNEQSPFSREASAH